MGQQKLSAAAAKRKEERDYAYAMEIPWKGKPTAKYKRKDLKADSQRRRRTAKKRGHNLAGKDFDHNTGEFTSIAHNRGGTQPANKPDGTKNEAKA
jgi:hypothetical protein